MKNIIASLCALAIAVAPTFAQTYSKDLEKKAKGGDTAAMIEVGDCYFNGSGTNKDPKKAKTWYEKAAKGGNIEAYQKLVACYSSWDGIEKNPQKAFEWTKKGAEAGDPQLKLALAKAYETGEGVATNSNFATREYIDAAYGLITEAFEPAIRGAIATGNDLDALSLGFAVDQWDKAPADLKRLAQNAMGLVMLHADYEEAANEFFPAESDPESDLLKFKAKMVAGKPFDARELERIISSLPGDDAEADFYRGVIAMADDRMPQAIDLFARSSKNGSLNGRFASFLIGSGVYDSGKYEGEYFNNDPMIAKVLEILAEKDKQVTRRPFHRHTTFNANILLGAGIVAMSDLDIEGVKRRVEENNADPFKVTSQLDLDKELEHHIGVKCLEKMERTDPRAKLLRWYKYEKTTLERPMFFAEMQALADAGVPMAAKLAQKAFNDHYKYSQGRVSDYEKAQMNAYQAQVDRVKMAAPSLAISSVSDFITRCHESIWMYQQTSNEADKAKYGARFNALWYMVDEWINPTPKKLEFIFTVFNNNAELLTRVFNEAATQKPEMLLKWAEERKFQPDVITTGLSLPDLLETAAKNATGETRNKLVKVLDSRYGRSI